MNNPPTLHRPLPGLLLGLLLGPLLGGCAASPGSHAVGSGLVTVSPRKAPEGVETFSRPNLVEGDRFIYRIGGVVKLPMRIAKADPKKGFLIVEEGINNVSLYDPDLGLKEVRTPSSVQTVQIRAPADSLFTWPLWVGKRWTCIYVEQGTNVDPTEVVANYHADAVETIKVPAGVFRCIRIWRRAVPTAAQDRYYRETSVMWYAPKVGFYVRRLTGRLEHELVDYQRQVPTAPASRPSQPK